MAGENSVLDFVIKVLMDASAMQEGADETSTAVTEMGDKMVETMTQTGDRMIEAFTTAIDEMRTALQDGLVGGMETTSAAVIDTITTTGDAIVQAMGTAGTEAGQAAGDAIAAGVASGAAKALEAVYMTREQMIGALSGMGVTGPTTVGGQAIPLTTMSDSYLAGKYSQMSATGAPAIIVPPSGGVGTAGERFKAWAAGSEAGPWVSGVKTLGGRAMSSGMNMSMVGLPIVMGTVKAAHDYLNFDQAMSQVNAVAHWSPAEYEQQKQAVMALSNESDIIPNATEIANGFYGAISAGWDPTQGLDATREAAIGSEAGNTDMDTAMQYQTVMLAAYGQSRLHGAALQAALQKVQDQGFAVVNNTRLRYPQLTSSVGRAVGAAANFDNGKGLDSGQLLAMVGTLNETGLQPLRAGQDANHFLASFGKPLKNSQIAAMQYYGVDPSFMNADTVNKMGLINWVHELYQKTGGNQNAIYAVVGDQTNADVVERLGGKGYGKFQQVTKAVQNSNGAAEQGAKEVVNSDYGQYQKAMNEFHNEMISFGKDALPVLTEIMKTIDGWLKSFENLPEGEKKAIEHAVVAFGAALAILGPLGMVIGGLTSLFEVLAAVWKLGGGNALVDFFKAGLAERGIGGGAGGASRTVTQGGVRTAENTVDTVVKDAVPAAENAGLTGVETAAGAAGGAAVGRKAGGKGGTVREGTPVEEGGKPVPSEEKPIWRQMTEKPGVAAGETVAAEDATLTGARAVGMADIWNPLGWMLIGATIVGPAASKYKDNHQYEFDQMLLGEKQTQDMLKQSEANKVNSENAAYNKKYTTKQKEQRSKDFTSYVDTHTMDGKSTKDVIPALNKSLQAIDGFQKALSAFKSTSDDKTQTIQDNIDKDHKTTEQEIGKLLKQAGDLQDFDTKLSKNFVPLTPQALGALTKDVTVQVFHHLDGGGTFTVQLPDGFQQIKTTPQMMNQLTGGIQDAITNESQRIPNRASILSGLFG